MYKSLCKVGGYWLECSPYVGVGDFVVQGPDGILIPHVRGKHSAQMYFGVVSGTFQCHPDEERENEERILRIRSK